ncbi:hypothetical protein BJ138DRAFT_1153090 [Hygrophoropsis aurantiaca]|uniref:Uncharacterized protein n=1 Tax=Hygrophoropsis aurantiaca TaxID=72124 RepID=A0ACB8AC97_9AGAM|nr:hypothetical protein BJ138DRAFT_1153090 [Hygrophoropsis aurantiaca]
MGVHFNTVLSAEDVISRAQHAAMKLRYEYPIVASYIDRRANTHQDLPAWVYVPLIGQAEAEAWLKEAFEVQRFDRPLDADSFILSINRTTLSAGRPTVRLYLLVGRDDSEYAIYIRGPHSIMDAWPTLSVLNLFFQWMTDEPFNELGDFPWGTEGHNLPVGPVIATGGLSSAWDTEGQELIMRIASVQGITKTPHTLKPQRQECIAPESTIRHRLIVDEDVSLRLLAKAKSLGFTVGHLFEAAQMLALATQNPADEADIESGAFIRNPQTFVSIEKDLVHPYKSKPHFISAHVWMPLYFPLKDLAVKDTPQQRLLNAMLLVKQQVASYTGNACFPQSLVKICDFVSPVGYKVPKGSYGNTYTNLGVIENRLPILRGRSSAGIPLMEITDMTFGHRWTMTSVTVHIWTFKSRLHIQVQAADNWDAEYLKAYVAAILEQASHILDDEELGTSKATI